jgi:hypothetical protein
MVMAGRVTHESRTALARARLFLDRADACTASERVDFEAFLEASIVFARAAIHRFKKQYGRHPDFDTWWDSLRGDPAVEFFRKERDWILKDAPPKIGQIAYAASVGSNSPSNVPTAAREFYYFEQGVPATATVAGHLQSPTSRLADAERKFSP